MHRQISNENCIPISFISKSQILVAGLLALIQAKLDFWHVATYNNISILENVLPNPPNHVVLLDSSVGLEQAAQWTQFWRKQSPPALVVVMEIANDIERILSCIEAGASAYTLKGSTVDEICKTIQLAAQGCTSCSPQITAQLFQRLARLKNESEQGYTIVNPLTRRETQVLSLIADGYSNKEIARDLVITVRTAKHHVHNILNKLELKRRYHAARYAQQQGWLS